MSTRSNLMINFDQMTLARVLQGSNFQVPTTQNSPSPIGVSSGVSPTTIFDVKKPVAGGIIYGVFTNQADTDGYDFQYPLNPGDTVTVSAIASNAATVTVTPLGGTAKTIYVIADTSITVAGVLIAYG